jgi:hypothetical protein
MESDKTKRKSTLQVLEGVSVPVPPGTKSRGRLHRPGDPEPAALRRWLLIGAALTAALIAGVLIGRFLLA